MSQPGKAWLAKLAHGPVDMSSFVEGGQMPFGMTLKDVERRRAL